MSDKQFIKQYQKQWQQATKAHQDSLDCQQLIKGIEQRRKRYLLEMIAGILIGLIVPVFILWNMYNGLPAIVDYVAMSFVMLLSLVVAFGGYFMRSGSAEQLGCSNVEYIKLTIEQLNYNIRLLTMGKMFCMVITILFSSLFLAMLGMSIVTGTSLSRPELAGAIMALIIICFPSLYWYQKRVQIANETQKIRLETVLAMMDD